MIIEMAMISHLIYGRFYNDNMRIYRDRVDIREDNSSLLYSYLVFDKLE